MVASTSPVLGLRSPVVQRLRVTLDDGARTTLHVVEHDRRDTLLRVQRLPGLSPLAAWCRTHDVREALVGGFYLRDVPGAASGATGVLDGSPLGELRRDGRALPSVPFADPWAARRGCLHVDGDRVRLARRDELPAEPAGDLLQAGPLLVRDGRPVDHEPLEGFSAGAAQFDSDITVGRHPRAALASDDERLLAVVCDGRADDEAGLTLDELAALLVELGARQALNLDGGGSASLVSGGLLRNVPRRGHDQPLPGGRPIATALTFAGRDGPSGRHPPARGRESEYK